MDFCLQRKAAIDAYAKTLHGEMEPFGVKVHSVITGVFKHKLDEDNNIEEMKNQFADSPYNVDGIVESGIASQKWQRIWVSLHRSMRKIWLAK